MAERATADMRTEDRIFTIRAPENEKMVVFMDQHRANHGRYAGAIGGRFTFSFTPTSIGTTQVISCACGEELDVTDYDSW